MKKMIYTIAAAATLATMSAGNSFAYQTRTITIIEDGECYYVGRRFTCDKEQRARFYKPLIQFNRQPNPVRVYDEHGNGPSSPSGPSHGGRGERGGNDNTGPGGMK